MPNSAKAGKRDPRIDPRKGDVFFKRGKRLDFTRIVRRVKPDEILFQDGFGQVCAATPEAFRRWAKDAEVIHAADDPVIAALVDECESEGR